MAFSQKSNHHCFHNSPNNLRIFQQYWGILGRSSSHCEIEPQANIVHSSETLGPEGGVPRQQKGLHSVSRQHEVSLRIVQVHGNGCRGLMRGGVGTVPCQLLGKEGADAGGNQYLPSFANQRVMQSWLGKSQWSQYGENFPEDSQASFQPMADSLNWIPEKQKKHGKKHCGD